MKIIQAFIDAVGLLVFAVMCERIKGLKGRIKLLERSRKPAVEPSPEKAREMVWDGNHLVPATNPPVEPSPETQTRTKEAARARREEKRADDEYFKSGTRYPGQ